MRHQLLLPEALQERTESSRSRSLTERGEVARGGGEGQVIETSDYSIAPPGIKVGTVVDAAPGPLGNEHLDRTIKIQPFVFDRAFTHVTVLTGSRAPVD